MMMMKEGIFVGHPSFALPPPSTLLCLPLPHLPFPRLPCPTQLCPTLLTLALLDHAMLAM